MIKQSFRILWFAYRLSGHELLPEENLEVLTRIDTLQRLSGLSRQASPMWFSNFWGCHQDLTRPFQACQHRFCFPGDFFAWASTPQPTFGSPKTGLKNFLKKLLTREPCVGNLNSERGGKPSSSCGPSWHIQPVKIWGFQSFEPKNLLLIQYVSGSCEARPGIWNWNWNKNGWKK